MKLHELTKKKPSSRSPIAAVRKANPGMGKAGPHTSKKYTKKDRKMNKKVTNEDANVVSFRPKDTRTDSQKYKDALAKQKEGDVMHREDAGVNPCPYCRDIYCDYDCEGSQDNMHKMKEGSADPFGGAMFSPPGEYLDDEEVDEAWEEAKFLAKGSIAKFMRDYAEDYDLNDSEEVAAAAQSIVDDFWSDLKASYDDVLENDGITWEELEQYVIGEINPQQQTEDINTLQVQDQTVMKDTDPTGKEFDVDTDMQNRQTGTIVKDKNNQYVVRQPREQMAGDKPVETKFRNDPTQLQTALDKQKKDQQAKAAQQPATQTGPKPVIRPQ